MKELRPSRILASRNLIKRRQRREKAMIDHLVRHIGTNPAECTPTRHSAFTECGLPIEDQIRKSWHPGPIGLPIF
jgi:hypothetical protein